MTMRTRLEEVACTMNVEHPQTSVHSVWQMTILSESPVMWRRKLELFVAEYLLFSRRYWQN